MVEGVQPYVEGSETKGAYIESLGATSVPLRMCFRIRRVREGRGKGIFYKDALSQFGKSWPA